MQIASGAWGVLRAQEKGPTRPQRHPPAPVRVALQAPAALTSFAAPLGCFTAARHITHTSILFHPRNLPIHHGAAQRAVGRCRSDIGRLHVSKRSLSRLFICLRSGSCFSSVYSSSSSFSLGACNVHPSSFFVALPLDPHHCSCIAHFLVLFLNTWTVEEFPVLARVLIVAAGHAKLWEQCERIKLQSFSRGGGRQAACAHMLKEMMKGSADHDNDAVAHLLTSRAALLHKTSPSRSRHVLTWQSPSQRKLCRTVITHTEPAESMQDAPWASWRAVPKRISGDPTE